ncbi:SDR family oxidoreductase [Altererythrobacter sp. KTW20L]|uniref:SDR family oxidoreductase n=1 Tax=Altererythrobacter sp. KTW20L TaxID=2942210 RepID=UPI0020C125E6|nr:SDR family oxidoreductase [Altererythrobacter sp. KTW20L]MCL6250616.1 SDR family oxidoreductase [Altererythrobacter sp. KTW20L]
MADQQTALIIGASRGLGAGLVRELAGRGWSVIGTQRKPSAELAEAGAAAIETVDIDDHASVTALAGKLAGQAFDLVLVNAGVTGPGHASADKVTGQELGALMMTNAVAPIRTARTLLPLVKDDGTVAFMSSGLGSVAGRTHDMAELYSASKAALNSLTRGFAAKDVAGKNVGVVNLHPGWVKTDMGGEGADIDVATSVAGMVDVLEANRGPGHKFLDYQGKTLPW